MCAGKSKCFEFLVITLALPAGLAAQPVLFDFDNAPVHAPLPITLSAGGITAQFSATGQGFSIQPANTMGFTPAGFLGNCIYPDSVFAADLLVNFSTNLTDFSILYAPQELGCDSSATMRVTAYLNGVFVGTTTTNASQPGTWPSETLAFSSSQPFNSVVVHYDARPACTDYGPIFMADNLWVTPTPPPIVLADAQVVGGAFQFSFAYTPATTLNVLAATNPSLPASNWAIIGGMTEISPGLFQFSDVNATNYTRRFYQVVRSP
jgi:hypothetical protein